MTRTHDEDAVFPKTGVSRTELTPVSFLRRTAALYPDKVGVVHGDERWTWREHEQRVDRLASALRAAGLTRHDRVAFLCRNLPPLLEAHLGVPAAGGVLVAINTRLASEEVGRILAHSGARWLFVDRALQATVAPLDLAGVTVIDVDEEGGPDSGYERFLAGGSAEPVEPWLTDEEEPITVNYTSGTTGRPKGVVYTHRGAYLNALGEVIEAGLTAESVYLWTLPMFHCNGWCFTWAVTAVGGTHVCLPAVDAGRIWHLLDSERVTHFNGAPVVHLGVVNHASAHPLDRPVTTVVAGAPPSPTLLGQMRAIGFHPLHVYGLTETYGPITVCAWQPGWQTLPGDDLARSLARQGQAYVVADLVRVVDEELVDVPRDGETMGEVVMRGNNVMRGYLNDPDLTDEAFSGGWFHSGDIAVWHPDGYVELRDRAKDIVISGGENISTIEVEQALTRHPAVLECAVVAIPDEKWGERPKAFVTLKPGATVSEAELLAFAREHLAHFKCPTAVEFVELPKTSTGKVQKYVLREKEWAGRDHRVN